ncbi:PTS fructose transporter subunit IIA [Liquorilactobacillus satsumensis]|uniref:PTS fructose transporter subunit IIA n=1 Tax=Liquorilactobacillus satsumensis TaxID=259059 RepID=UPI001E5B3E24|nr:PTS fructose transporter subunit IIA [Liquorilactobacillus satsumensis]MCC7667070.1 PTS fructose transporter subunit IIA [Liquorilactobacillus satsumensis]MCP9358699.1 PTS fructose transporter subunit IIA [Liquorilactobacillus satsumensis]MCP9371984.1 PTS fructose transporter subunit IIA [Liquorilactobacillus satsumensis]
MFKKENIILDATGGSKKEVLDELARKAFSLNYVSDAIKLLDDLLEREEESTTGFGNGVAIPHTKSRNVLEPTILFERTIQQIEWNSLDDKPVTTLICILVPANESNEHLRILAKLSRQLVHKEFVDKLKEYDADHIYMLINQIIGEE